MSSDGSGHVYVTWEDFRNGLWDIYFNYSCDYGATWKASGIRLDTGDTPGGSHSRWPELSSDDSGHICDMGRRSKRVGGVGYLF